ncbi:type II toxin-antitoxin system HipA family toxin [Photobacterium sp. 1_MG-2023]|uniref:type II toxin-antitoxin system HipA family toxin n=1 Tax=Photobacterium sp. 1_MG-2023 TaxID=3062646 RepID=UPI0026E42F18|nr:type II toxin-antitoxin system HipA family toxin [Photobacterium sp. 1_MG-2023]MDO6706031.1 type II toxin-antitoxin system HipA family toxin [Photobacterium sp. 1_MG-2023]
MTLAQLPGKIEQITVCLENDALGVLTHGSVHHYQPTQTQRHVSLTMTKPNLDGYSSGALHPVFAQNLPEGFNRRFIAEKLARYARVNDMYLLALQGHNGIGMLAYQSDLKLPEAESVSLSDILTYQGSTPLFPQLLEKYYLRNALAGVQPKVSIPRTDRTVEQKDLIVKSFDEEFPLLTVNEYVCMEAARFCGLAPPNTYLSENLETFIVERFDKPEGQRLGYEDFTTLMKKPNHPDAKYSGSYETLLKATHLYTHSLDEVEKMYRYIVFNCLIGNGDAHLKNYALQYTQDMKHIFVSPPFDITHTLIYDTIDNKMALKLANSKVFPDRNHLLKLAESTSFRIRHAAQIIDATAQGILDYLQHTHEAELMPGLKASIEAAVSQAMTSGYSTKSYRHDKKRKFE